MNCRTVLVSVAALSAMCAMATARGDEPAPAAPPVRTASDRMQLDSSAVTGNRELPKVLYIVPWQQAAAGRVEGRPVDSLIDELLAPVDRDTFSRELRYYTQLAGEEKTVKDVESEE